MIEICNLRNEKHSEPWDFKIDRTTPLGNPFIVNGEPKRDWSCDQYDNNFEDMIKKPKVKDYLDSLIATYKIYGKLRLFCWCAPKRCHGETIKRYLEDLSE